MKPMKLFLATLVILMLIPSAFSLTSVYDCLDLQDMNGNLGEDYVLENDIDCSNTSDPANATLWNLGLGFLPIGNATSPPTNYFTGTFNGQNYTISGLFINRTATDYIGLFGFANGAEIADVRLADVNITAQDYVGGLVGSASSTNIINCSVSGSVTGVGEVGGLVGYAYGGSSITNSYAAGIVTGTGLSSRIGGLVGYMHGASLIDNSYATGDVNGTEWVGGLVGRSLYSPTIDNSYATGDVECTGSNGGGLVGYNDFGSSVNNSYATGDVECAVSNCGGLVGRNNAGSSIDNSYWYNSTANNGLSCVGLDNSGDADCTAETDETYFFATASPPMDAWDFTNIWDDVFNGSDYPPLLWQDEELSNNCSSTNPPEDMDCPGVTVDYAVDAYINVSASFSNCFVTGLNIIIGPGGNVTYDSCMVSFDRITVQAGGSFVTRNRP